MNLIKNLLKLFGKKTVLLILSFVIVIPSFVLTGCSDNTKAVYEVETEAKSISSQVLSTNSEYEMSWNDDLKCILLKSIKTGKIWSNIPYEYQLEGGSSANLNSTLNIIVSSQKNMEWTTVRGYTDAYENGRIFSEKIKNGIKVTYCFDKYEISVPVDYILREDSVEISIDPNEIVESGNKYLLVAAEVSPFMCSTLNADNNSYLFIPSGSGALMYAKEHLDGERSWSGEVYGIDVSRTEPRSLTIEESIRMPIFGIKAGEHSMLAIIENNAGSAVINASVGNSRTGYSIVYPTVYFRGYDVFDQDNKGDLKRVSGELSSNVFSIGYYPLKNGAGITEMADKYREYLSETGSFETSNVKNSPYSLTVLGGVVTTTSFLGIPKKELQVMTTFSDVKKIVAETIELTDIEPIVRIMGFGNSGINTGEIGGGFELPKVYGSKKERQELIFYLKNQKISAFFDFDLVRYSESGGGFSYINDTAKTAIFKRAERYVMQGPFREFNKDLNYRIIKRSLLSKATDNAIKMANKYELPAISLSTITNTAYSDYFEKKYYTKGNIEKDVAELLKRVKKSGYNISASAANAYAGGISDVIFDVPVNNGEYDNLDESIPFYQMVYRDIKPLYSPAVNLDSNPKKSIMIAATSGIGLGFTVIGDYDVSYDESQADKLYGMLFDDNQALIKDSIEILSRLYNNVSGAKINAYDILENGITKTVFDNGVTVFANHTNQVRNCPLGSLEPYGFEVDY